MRKKGSHFLRIPSTAMMRSRRIALASVALLLPVISAY
jgi:hypothetical protein